MFFAIHVARAVKEAFQAAPTISARPATSSRNSGREVGQSRGKRRLLHCCYDPNNGFVTSLCYSYLELEGSDVCAWHAVPASTSSAVVVLRSSSAPRTDCRSAVPQSRPDRRMQAQLPFAVVQNIIRLADGDDLSTTDDDGSFAAPSFVQRRQHHELERQIYGLRLELTAVCDSPDVAQGTQCEMAPPTSRAPEPIPSVHWTRSSPTSLRSWDFPPSARRGSLLRRRLPKLLTNVV